MMMLMVVMVTTTRTRTMTTSAETTTTMMIKMGDRSLLSSFLCKLYSFITLSSPKLINRTIIHTGARPVANIHPLARRYMMLTCSTPQPSKRAYMILLLLDLFSLFKPADVWHGFEAHRQLSSAEQFEVNAYDLWFQFSCLSALGPSAQFT